MQNKDNIKKSLQNALHNSTVPLKNELWDKLSLELDKDMKTKKQFWMWFTIIGLSLSAILFVGNNLLTSKKQNNNPLTTAVIKQGIVKNKETKKEQPKLQTLNSLSKIIKVKPNIFKLKEIEKSIVVIPKTNKSQNNKQKLVASLNTTKSKKQNYANKENFKSTKTENTLNNKTKLKAEVALIEEKETEAKEITDFKLNNEIEKVDVKEKLETENTETNIVKLKEDVETTKTNDENRNAKSKNLKQNQIKGNTNKFSVAVKYALGKVKHNVTSFIKPQTVHREFENLVESNLFVRQQIGLNFSVPIPKTNYFVINFGLEYAKTKSTNFNAYTLNYATVRDSTFNIIGYFSDSGRYSIKQSSALSISQFVVPISTTFYLPIKNKSKVGLNLGLNLNKINKSAGHFLNVNEFEIQDLNSILQKNWSASLTFGLSYTFALTSNLGLSSSLQWQSTSLKTNIGYTNMQSSLKGINYGLQLTYNLKKNK